MTALAKQDTREVARPLKVLEKLIREALENANKAGMAYYKTAGELLNEARDGHYENDAQGFYEWVADTFGIMRTQARTWMALTSVTSRKPFKSLEELKRKQNPDRYNQTIGRRFREWTQPVDAVAEKARDEARRLAAEDALTHRQEREAEAKLGLRLIDIGYRVLAKELHPDKGGSREAMHRLGRVRDRLRSNV